MLSIITGVAALAFSPLAIAEDATKPLGTNTPEEQPAAAEEQPAAAEEQPAAAEEQMQPVGGDAYGGIQPKEDVDTTQEPLEPMGGSTYGAAPIEPQPSPVVSEPMIEEEPVVVEEDTDTDLYTSFGMSLSVGGGVTDFVDDSAEDVTDVGGAWDARLAIGTRSIIGIEAAYVGTAQDMDALGLDDDAVLVSNGVEGLARLNLGNYFLQPYVVGGVGWSRYEIVNEDFNTSAIDSSDDIVTVPLGAGLDAKLGGGFLLDGRFTYRTAFNDDMFDAMSDGADLDNWNVSARLGYEF